MPKNKKQPKDMTTEEIAKAVFPPKLHKKLREIIEEIDEDKKPKPNTSLQE